MMNQAPTDAVDPREVAQSWLASMDSAFAGRRSGAVVELFGEDCWWRDVLGASWDFRTLRGREQIGRYLDSQICPDSESDKPALFADFALLESVEPTVREGEGQKVVEAFLRWRSSVGTGVGVVRLRRSGDRWLAWTLMTALQELNGRELSIGSRRKVHLTGGAGYRSLRRDESEFVGAEPTVLILGAGQAGLGLAAYLTLMGVPNLIVERNARVGDNWRKRYESLVLHDPVWQDHLPFLHFPSSWPVWTPKDKLADWFESYVAALDLNVWTSCELVESSFDADDETWTVRLRRESGERVIRPQHLVLATGTLTDPNVPAFEGEEGFQGTLVHSSRFGSGADWAGRRAVVVGVCNSGQDIARDLAEHGANVTLLQRSPVYVISQKTGRAARDLSSPYVEGGPPVEVADLLTLSTPNLLAIEHGRSSAKRAAEADKELLDGLTARGFLIDDGSSSGGTIGLALRRAGGFLLDVGSTSLIIDGTIAVKTGSIEKFVAHGIVLDDGVELPADLVVLATGYQGMRESVRRILGDEVAERCGEIWGLDDEGELRTIWRSSGHPGLWVTGGALIHTRIFSRYLALQIAARVDGFWS